VADIEVLDGGIANAGAVARDGDHVLRPSSVHTPTIHAFLRCLREESFEGASQPIGRDLRRGAARPRLAVNDTPGRLVKQAGVTIEGATVHHVPEVEVFLGRCALSDT
jgi:hypothetical protein